MREKREAPPRTPEVRGKDELLSLSETSSYMSNSSSTLRGREILGWDKGSLILNLRGSRFKLRKKKKKRKEPLITKKGGGTPFPSLQGAFVLCGGRGFVPLQKRIRLGVLKRASNGARPWLIGSLFLRQGRTGDEQPTNFLSGKKKSPPLRVGKQLPRENGCCGGKGSCSS